MYLYLLVLPWTCCNAGSLRWDQSPPNADTLNPCQSFTFPDHIYFEETSSAGSIIFESNKINSTKQEWRISNNDRVALTFVKQTYQIRLLTVVDLDVTNPSDNCVSGLQQFVQSLKCIRTGGLQLHHISWIVYC